MLRARSIILGVTTKVTPRVRLDRRKRKISARECSFIDRITALKVFEIRHAIPMVLRSW